MSNPMVIQPDDSCDHLLEPRVLSTRSDNLDASDQLDALRTTEPQRDQHAKTTFHCGQCRTIFGSQTSVRAHCKMTTCWKKQEMTGKMASFLAECDKVNAAMRDIRNVVKSNFYPLQEKSIVMESFKNPFIDLVNTPLFLNPISCPRLDRKRVHKPQNRSYFPSKTIRPDPRIS